MKSKKIDNKKQVIIFTDLDGTLLDHQTYDYTPALPAINQVLELKIPLILASSKTADEIAALQMTLGIQEPAITENGSGLWIPDGYFPENKNNSIPSISYNNILEILSDIPSDLRAQFQGFCDWTVEQVAEKTGLEYNAAAKAKNRHWSIPGIWSGDEKNFHIFCNLLRNSNLQVTKGGRFIHIMADKSKGDMLNWLTNRFKEKYPLREITSVALGDAPNDRSMLEAADFAFIIPNALGTELNLRKEKTKGHVRYASQAGPFGWNESVMWFLNNHVTNDQA